MTDELLLPVGNPVPCPRHQCEKCGRYVAKATVVHAPPRWSGVDYEYWATGCCAACSRVDVVCVP